MAGTRKHLEKTNRFIENGFEIVTPAQARDHQKRVADEQREAGAKKPKKA